MQPFRLRFGCGDPRRSRNPRGVSRVQYTASAPEVHDRGTGLCRVCNGRWRRVYRPVPKRMVIPPA